MGLNDFSQLPHHHPPPRRVAAGCPLVRPYLRGGLTFPRPAPFHRSLGGLTSNARQRDNKTGSFPQLALQADLHDFDLADGVGVVLRTERPFSGAPAFLIEIKQPVFQHRLRPPARTARRRGYSSPSRANRCDNGYVAVTITAAGSYNRVPVGSEQGSIEPIKADGRQ